MFQWLASRKKAFAELLSSQAHLALQGLWLLRRYLDAPGQEFVDEIQAVERKGDETRRRLVELIHGTFITPFEREDLHALSRALDDVLDYCENTVEELELYKVDPNRWMVAMVEALQAGAGELYAACQLLMQSPQEAARHAVLAKATENQTEALYRQALAELFSLQDFQAVFKLREIYRHLSNSADRIDDAGNLITDIAIKNP